MNLKKFLNLLFEEHLPGTAVFVGRLQPITLAHYNIIDQARKTYDDIFIILVSGSKTKKQQNPFTFKQRAELVYKAFNGKIPMSHILKAPTGFTPDILDYLDKYISRKKLKKKFVLFAGADRADDYKRQIDNYYKGAADVEVKTISREDDSISATKVRKALLDNNLEEFKRLTPKNIWPEFDKLRNIILKKINNISEKES